MEGQKPGGVKEADAAYEHALILGLEAARITPVAGGGCTRRETPSLVLSSPFRMPFAGESEIPSPDSILSHCYGALLPMFTTKEATVLRLVCKEFKDTIAEFPWEDADTRVYGSIADWRACFPKARWANVAEFHWNKGRKTPVVDADFVHFVGLRGLDMSYCTSITDAAFVHLKGIHTLLMGGCSSITDAAFVHLRGVSHLSIRLCRELTDAAFVHLKGIHTLDMSSCEQATITDAAFAHLKGMHTLDMSFCQQVTDGAFVHLGGVTNLDMSYCWLVTDAAFPYLRGIHTLNMSSCPQDTITDAAISHLQGIQDLDVWGCTQLTSAVFEYLKGVKRLNINGCPNLSLIDDSLKGVQWLNMLGHSQDQIERAKALGYPVVEVDLYQTFVKAQPSQ